MSTYLQARDETKEFFTAERCHILELLHNHQEKHFSIARARVEPGITTAWHRLKKTTEYYYILEGQGWMEIGEDEGFHVTKGDIVTIPPDTAQRITNTEVEGDLIFLAICAPAFRDACYEAC